MVYLSNIDDVALVIDTTHKLVLDYRYRDGADKNIKPKYQRVADNLFYKIGEDGVIGTTLYKGTRDNKGKWNIQIET